MRRQRFLIVVLAGFVLAGCGHKRDGGTGPQALLPPEVESVYPVARAIHVPFETEIWVRFASPLDSATVNDRSVFLKVDEARIPSRISLDSGGRRIRVTPLGPLALRRTHTVILTPRITSTDGTALEREYFWQFTTTGVRRPDAPFPANGTLGESPFVRLAWAGTDASAGDIRYRIFISQDPEAVATRTVVPIMVDGQSAYLSRARWPMGVILYWSVTAENRSSGEEIDGPVWSFGILAVETPVDSLLVPASEWGFIFRTWTSARCNLTGVTSGPDYTCLIRWPLDGLSPGLRVANAVLVVRSTSSDLSFRNPSLWVPTSDARACDLQFPGPPFADVDIGPIALALIVEQNQFRFESDRLAATVEAAIRWGGPRALLVRTERTSGFSPVSEAAYGMQVYYYRTSGSGAGL